jgi:hypothetical protein
MSECRKLPYKLYLHTAFLLNIPDQAIQDGFIYRGLVTPTPDLLQAYRADLWNRMPKDVKEFYAQNTGPIATLAELEPVRQFIEKTLDMPEWLNQQLHFREAKMFFDQSDLRICMFSHIMSRQSDEDALETLESMLHYKSNMETIQVFKKYFCCQEVMDYVAWKEWVVELRMSCRDEAVIYQTANSHRIPFDFIRWKMHSKIVKMPEPDDMLKNMVVMCYYKALETFEAHDDFHFDIPQSWFEKFLRAYEKHKVLGKGKDGGADAEMKAIEEGIFQIEYVRKPKIHVGDLFEVTKQVPLIEKPSEKAAKGKKV